MRLDKYSNPVFNEQDLFDALYQGHQFNVYDTMLVERNDNVKQLETQLGFKFLDPYETHFEIADYDSACQSNWLMPDEYKTLDIEAWLFEQSPPWDPEHTRVTEELNAYKERNMLNLLRWLKYFVDTCSKEGVVWGIGRGSSVASYILFLIGVHNVDSIKYNLDWREFLR
jgi:DNA polymerase III alpha subunit